MKISFRSFKILRYFFSNSGRRRKTKNKNLKWFSIFFQLYLETGTRREKGRPNFFLSFSKTLEEKTNLELIFDWKRWRHKITFISIHPLIWLQDRNQSGCAAIQVESLHSLPDNLETASGEIGPNTWIGDQDTRELPSKMPLILAEHGIQFANVREWQGLLNWLEAEI